MAELQTIPARHGVATFVPAGQTIKIINKSGSQVVDTWAFALPTPETKKTEKEQQQEIKNAKDAKSAAEKEPAKKEEKPAATPKSTPAKKGKKGDLPSQEDAEKATKEGLEKGEDAAKDDAAKGTPSKSTWSSYVPSVSVPTMGFGSGKKAEKKEGETEQQANSRTWASYFPSGQGFGNYIPKQASNTVSSFSSMHQRDPSKSYVQQLTDFSKTPVGAAGVKGMAAVTGTGSVGSLMAGYQAYNAANAQDAPPMEFMSMQHSRAESQHLIPRVNDLLVTNLREPIMTLVEDTSPGVHDTLIAACDPARYKGLGVNKWEEHGSCAENLVLALKELNERAGLKGAKAIGADVTINNVPAPLNLFMNIPWDNDGDIGFKAPKSKAGDYVRLKAERDIVVVMSACPQDVLDINGKNPTDAEFVVEDGEEPSKALKRTQPAKKPVPKKKAPTGPSRAQSTAGGADNDDAKSTVSSAPRKKPVPPKVQPSKKAGDSAAPAKKAAPPAKKPSPPAKKPPPPASKPPAKKTAPPPSTTSNATESEPAEKKKPRKLAPRAKPSED